MSIDESQVAAAVAAVIDPELRRPLGELAMVGSAQVKAQEVAVEIALPWPTIPRWTSCWIGSAGRWALLPG